MSSEFTYTTMSVMKPLRRPCKSGMNTHTAPYNIQGSRGDCEHFIGSGDPQGTCYK